MTLYFDSYQICVCFSNYEMCVLNLSVVSDSVTLWTVASQAALSMGFPRQEYWSGRPFPSPGTEPTSPALAGGFFTNEPTWGGLLLSLANAN